MCCIDQKLPKNTHAHLPSITQSLLIEDIPCGHQQQQHGDRRPDLLLLLLRVWSSSATSATAPASLVAVIFLLIARLLSELLEHGVSIVVGMVLPLILLFGCLGVVVRRRLVVAPLLVVVVGLFRRWHLALGEEVLKA